MLQGMLVKLMCGDVKAVKMNNEVRVHVESNWSCVCYCTRGCLNPCFPPGIAEMFLRWHMLHHATFVLLLTLVCLVCCSKIVVQV